MSFSSLRRLAVISLSNLRFNKLFIRDQTKTVNIRFLSFRNMAVLVASATFGFEMEKYQRLKINSSATSISEEAERLYQQGKNEEIKSLLEKYISENPSSHADAHWRLARAYHDSITEMKDGPLRKELAYKAYEEAKKAIALDPNNFACHKWIGITLSTIGDYEGIKAKISNAYLIKEHFEQATKLNPLDATSFHLIGLWCMTFADMSWYTAKIASAIFATPPSSTYQEALNYFIAAEEIEEGFYKKNQFMIATAYYKMGNKEDAKKWVLKCLALPIKNHDDQLAHEDAMRLKSLL